jgi:uncharacterized protein (DUF58 family)
MLPEPFTPHFLAQLEALRLRTRKEFLGGHAGSYAAPRRGASLEFADYRKYAPGDDLRYLDWGIYARSDRLYIKLFHEEMDLFVYVFIDASGSMAFPSISEKFLPASHIAAAIAYVVLANQDHVKIHLLGEPGTAKSSPFYRGRLRMVDCVQFTAAAVPGGSLDMAAALAHHLKTLRRPGKAILISDFLMPVASYQQGLNLLRAFNLDIAAIQVLARSEVDPPLAVGGIDLIDSETGAAVKLQWNDGARRAYQAKLAQHNSEIRSFCHQSGIHYSLYVTDRDFSNFVFATLGATGLLK